MSDPNSLSFEQGDPKWEALRKRALTDLYWFCANVLGYAQRVPMREPTHLLLCKFVEKRTGHAALDQARYRKIEMPRETGKTTLVTQGYVIQRVCANPDISILIANEKEQNAKDFLSAIKYEFESNELLRALFPEVVPVDFTDTTWSASRIVVRRSSGRKEPTISTIGVGGTVTGLHFDLIVCDDIISREAMENARAGSRQIMEQTNRWIHQLQPLLSSNADPFPEIIFIGTRWWYGDSYEHIETAFGYGDARRPYLLRVRFANGETQQLPAWRVGDLALFRRAAIEEGRSIFPEKWDLEELAKIRVRDETLFACLPAGEPILTRTGMRRIEQIAVGELVQAKDGRWHRVVARGSRFYRGTAVRLTTYGQGTPLTLTTNHKVWASPCRKLIKYASSYSLARDEPFQWIRADELRRGDIVSVPIVTHCIPVRGLEATPDFWFLVGHFIGDGSLRSNGAVDHCFNPTDRVLAERIASIIHSLFQRKARIYDSGSTIKITYRHPWAARFFAQVRRVGNSQKWLLPRYEQLPLPLQEALVAGYLSADGHTTEAGRTVAVSVSFDWLCQLQRILLRLGRVSYMSKPKRNVGVIWGRKVNTQPVYQLWIYESQRHAKAWIVDDTLYRRVRTVEQLPFTGDVYNIEVEGEHSYVSGCNSLTYQNCNYLNDPSDEVTATFKESWLQYYDALDEQTFRLTDGSGAKRNYALDDLDRLIFVDPGGFGTRSVEDRARAAVVVVGTSSRAEHLLLALYSEKDTFLRAAEKVIEFVSRYAPRKVVVEQAGQQAAFIELLRRMLADAGLTVTLEAVKPGATAKEQRILTLEPLFQRGSIFVGRGPNFHEFREQFRTFPRAARLDVLDALAYLPAYAKKHARLMSPAARQAQELDSYYARRGLANPAGSS